jgi:hypothetical protein
MATFSKGQIVKFDRNSATKMASTVVSAVVPMLPNAPQDMKQSYIIEYPQGWTPNEMRISQFDLDIAKKYLFVSENELTAI